MIDNFWFIEERIKDLKPGEFYPVMILKRKKENPELKGCKVIYHTNIYNLKDLNESKDKLIKTCTEQNARCYVKINKRSDEKVSETLVRYVLDRHLKKEFHFVREAYAHCVGISDASEIRYFLIDVDIDVDLDVDDIAKENTIKEIEKCLDELKILKRMKDYPVYKLTTKNGFHILAPGFDVNFFNNSIKVFSGIDISIKKDADTLIYIA